VHRNTNLRSQILSSLSVDLSPLRVLADVAISSGSKLARAGAASFVLNLVLALSKQDPPENAIDIYRHCLLAANSLLLEEREKGESVDTVVRSVLTAGAAIQTTNDILKGPLINEILTLTGTIRSLQETWAPKLGDKALCLSECVELLQLV